MSVLQPTDFAKKKTATWLLTVGLALVFGIFGIDKFVHPLLWIQWMPTWIDGLFGLSKNIWLQVFGALEILFAAMLLIPIRNVRRASAILICLHLIGILSQMSIYSADLGFDQVAVRDIGLLLASAALFFLL